MRALGLALLWVILPVICAQADQAQGPLQKFTGTAPQTTPAFTVPDKWEVRWVSQRNLNISVLAADGTLVAGAASFQGALYVPKGGSYHLQIDCVPFSPPTNNGNGAPPPSTQSNNVSGIQNAVNDANDDSSTNAPPNNRPPPNNGPRYGPNGAPYPYPMMFRPWYVEVVGADAVAAQGSMSYMPSFNVPASVASSPDQTSGNPAPAPAPAPIAKLTEDQSRAVVLIQGDNAEGTGFLIKTPDGPAVVTNIHVIANNPNLKITTNTGALVNMLSAKGASDRDLAMLAIQDGNYSYLQMATDISTIVQPGDEVVTPGNSQGGEVMLNTDGKVLGIGPERIEIDNPIYHGNSGGPVIHVKSGKVLGVVTEAMKVDLSNDLDKASFASRNSAISGSMRYFGLRLDTVTEWVPIDSRRFQIETTFLDQFHEQSRRLDAYLNTTDNSQTDNSNSGDNSSGNDASKIYLSDEKIMKANDNYLQEASGSDTTQRMEALKGLLFDLQGVADLDVNQIQNANNFYSFDRERAHDELDYRKALKAELDAIGNNVDRLSSLPRTNN
ncbi:MAG: serine protease [Methylacidiphilales bacterium]|nr:serine protease [Candidatus Methylacidiphilales bacterium]